MLILRNGLPLVTALVVLLPYYDAQLRSVISDWQLFTGAA